MTTAAIPTELLLQLRSLALVELAQDGTTRWANAGFERLLPAEAWDDAPVQARRYFLSPSLADLQALARSGKSPCYQGLLTIGDPEGQPQSLRGSVLPRDGGLLVVAEHDLEEMARVSDAAMRLSADLTRSQRELIAINRRLAEREAEIHSLSVTDQLTGLGNRRQLDQTLANAINGARRHGRAFCVVMVDLDHFKAVNDAFGHAIGDALLQSLGAVLENGVRNTDTVCRFGGEEFAIVMPDIEIDSACACSERIRAHVERISANADAPRVTATFGVAQWEQGDTAESLLQRADKYLYQGKEEGRNRVICGPASQVAASSGSASERAQQSWTTQQRLRHKAEHASDSTSSARREGSA